VLSDGSVVAVSATIHGFCVRQSDELNPSTPQDSAPPHVFHMSISSCLAAANHRFKSNFARFVSERFKRDPCEMLPSTTICPTSWLIPPAVKQSIFIHSQLLSDSITPQRDWNEDVSALLSLPPEEYLSRDRNIIKTHVEFMEAARAVAIAAVDGALTPLNPFEDVQSHIYIANNMFASRCIDNFDPAARCFHPCFRCPSFLTSC
jgi:protein TIF31